MAEIHSTGRRRGLVSSKRKGRRGLHVPEELLEEILVRLPVKSIIRFESVCKTWRSKFHSEPFIELYDGRSYQRMRGDELETFHAIKSKDVYKMAPGLFNRKKERVISATGLLSHGIYCLTSVYKRHHPDDEDLFSLLTLKIALCNPATHQSKLLHPLPRKFRPLLARISEKPCRIVCGFGTVVVEEDSSSLDYRVVVLINYGSEDDLFWCPCFLVFVYSSQRGKWKRIVDYRPRKRNVGPSKATDAFKGSRITGMSSPLEACPQRFFKGCWYWITTRQINRHIRPQCQFDVLSFNFARQSFQFIGAPPAHVFGLYSSDDVKADVFVLHDHLAVIYLTNNVVGRYVEFDVWMMMDYGVAESWTRVYTVNPNFEAQFTTRTLYGIDYEEEISGAVRIKRLLFLDPYNFDYICARDYIRRVKTGKIISFDDNGGHQATTLRPRSDQICLSTAGISTYVETLRRL